MGHRVYAAGAADNFPARPMMSAPGSLQLRTRTVIPIKRRAGKERPARWISDGGVICRTACLDEGDARVTVLAKPGGEHAARTTGTNDHVIELRYLIHQTG